MVSDRLVLVLAVDDVDRFAGELTANGVKLLSPPEDRPDWGIRTAHFRDPEGNLVEMYAPLRSSS
jgi:predicted enzyme related to lactoylglutathione lyase